jgi:hypothetical protein
VFSSSTIFARVMLMLDVKGLSIVWCTFVIALNQAPSDMHATLPVVVGAAVLACLPCSWWSRLGCGGGRGRLAGTPDDQQDK